MSASICSVRIVGLDDRAEAVEQQLHARRFSEEGETRAERARAGEAMDEQREAPGRELGRIGGLEVRELLLQHRQRQRHAQRRGERPDPGAVGEHCAVRAVGGNVRPHLDASAARVDGERRLVLPHLRSCGSGPRCEQLDAAVGREHRVVGLVEADHVVGRCELRVAPPDLRGVDGLVHYTGTRHRLAERGEMRRVGRPEVEAPALHE